MSNDPEKKYDDIINLPHHVSATRPHMSQHDRAAQFSPFAALTGHDADQLDQKVQILRHCSDESPRITVRYFEPDAKKAGGAYVTASGRLKKIDDQRRILVLEDQAEIPVNRIIALDGDVF